MPSIDITKNTIIKVLADVGAGAPRTEITDSRTRGLVLRVGPTGAAWQFRYKVNGRSVRLPLGAVAEWSIAQAREIATAASTLVKSGRGFPDPEWLKSYLEKSGKIEVERPAVRPAAVARTWRLEQGRELWLAEILRTRRPGTHTDYKGMLNHPAIAAIETRPLAGITRQEMAGIIARVHATGTESTAEHLVRVVRPFWKWLAADGQAGKSGVKPGTMDGLAAPERTLDEKPVGEYVPSMAELGRIVAIARSGALDPVIGSAIELLVWTLQRRRAVASAETAMVRRIGDDRGLWLIPPASRKSRKKSGAIKRDHAIPLPAPAMECFVRAETIAHKKKSVFLFPQFRPRSKGGEVTHVSGSVLTHTLGFMPGVQASPHDIRRAFGTHGEQTLGLLRADTKAILDHGSESGDVTGSHYALHDGTHRTWAIMEAWCAALVPEIEKAVAELEPVAEIKGAMDAARYRARHSDDGLAIAAE